MWIKTQKGQDELRPGVRTLGQRERTLLLLVDGKRDLTDFSKIVGEVAQSVLASLVQNGYVSPSVAPEASPARSPAKGAALTKVVSAPSASSENKIATPEAHQPSSSSDSFEGKRSLATTKMFLLDISERMFVRKDPELAEKFRSALRESRDRDSMLAVSRMMLDEVEKIAGPERADSIAERIAYLLPPEAAPAV